MILSWVGTGRCLSSLDFSVEDYGELEAKLVNAAQKMKRDAWWISEQEQPGMEKAMRNGLIKEMAGSLIQAPQPLKTFYTEIMQRKHDDHVASHSNLINQFFHLLSSSVFIFCYVFIFFDLTQAMCIGLAALFVRQFGHAILEPPCHDKEQALLGFNTRDKSFLVGGYLLLPVVHLIKAGSMSPATLASIVSPVAHEWFFLTAAVVLGHVAYLVWKFNFRTSMIWFIKLITDPFTDLAAYYDCLAKMFAPSYAQKA